MTNTAGRALLVTGAPGRFLRYVIRKGPCIGEMATKTLDQYIAMAPGVLGVRPRIAGRRIAVEHIVVWHEWMGRSSDEIAGEYDLSLTEIYAALAYYYDHQQEIDESIQAAEALVDKAQREIPSKIPSDFK